MRRIMATAAAVLVAAAALMPALVAEAEAHGRDGVDIRWEGRHLVVTNNNDYSIYNLWLGNLTLTGFIVFGRMVAINTTISEVLPGASVSFSLGTGMLFGFGPARLTVMVSYLGQGERVRQEATTSLFLLGPFTLFLG
ncbi:MAG: hypothetical protein ACP5EK_00985 [Thermoplasmatota archaeon]